MKDLLPLLALVAAAPDAPDQFRLPPPLVVAFETAHIAIQRVGMCMGPMVAYESVELDALDQRFFGFQDKAVMTWGYHPAFTQSDITMMDDDAFETDCTSDHVSALFVESDASLALLETSLNDHLAAFNNGVWIGPIPLCGRTPVHTAITTDILSEMEALSVTLDEPAGTELALLTDANVGHRLAIRVNGEVVVAPVVHEALRGQFQIAGPERPELERIASLLLQCAKP